MSGEPMTAMQELLARNRTRRRIRFWSGIAAIPIALVALLLVAKLLSMVIFAQQAMRAFAAEDAEGTVAAAQWQQPLNWFEPYKAHFNRGTGLAETGDLDGARQALERAVPLAPGLEVCAVRYNLATVVERQGDVATEDGDAAAGQDLYREALGILAENPEECRTDAADPKSPDPGRSTPESIDELERRILAKLQQDPPQEEQPDDGSENPEDSEQEPPEADDGPSDSQLEELERKLEEGERERQEREQGSSDGAPGGTDRPW